MRGVLWAATLLAAGCTTDPCSRMVDWDDANGTADSQRSISCFVHGDDRVECDDADALVSPEALDHTDSEPYDFLHRDTAAGESGATCDVLRYSLPGYM